MGCVSWISRSVCRVFCDLEGLGQAWLPEKLIYLCDTVNNGYKGLSFNAMNNSANEVVLWRCIG